MLGKPPDLGMIPRMSSIENENVASKGVSEEHLQLMRIAAKLEGEMNRDPMEALGAMGLIKSGFPSLGFFYKYRFLELQGSR